MYVTLRKSFIEPKANQPWPDMQTQSSLESEHREIIASYKDLLDDQRSLQTAFENLKRELADAIDDCETRNRVIINLEKQNALQSEILEKCDRESNSLKSQLLIKDTEIEDFRKEIKTKSTIIQNINKGFNEKINILKGEIGVLEEFKVKKLKEEKGRIKKEKKLLKKQRKRAQKKEASLVDSGSTGEVENNNEFDDKAFTEDDKIGPINQKCDICSFSSKSESVLREHVIETHKEEIEKVQKKFEEQHHETAKLLEDVPENELIFTAEEICQFSVDWKILEEILEILQKKKENT